MLRDTDRCRVQSVRVRREVSWGIGVRFVTVCQRTTPASGVKRMNASWSLSSTAKSTC